MEDASKGRFRPRNAIICAEKSLNFIPFVSGTVVAEEGSPRAGAAGGLIAVVWLIDRGKDHFAGPEKDCRYENPNNALF